MRSVSTRIVCFIALALGIAGCSHPSDTAMITRYQKNSDTFTFLKETALEYPGLNLTMDSVRNFPEPNDDTLIDLRNEMSELRVERVTVSRSGDTVRLNTSTFQRGFNYSEKGYVFSSHQPIPNALEDRLDDLSMQTEVAGFPIYRSIGNDWYLYIKFTD